MLRSIVAACLVVAALIAPDVSAQVVSYRFHRRNSFNQEPNGSGYFISSDVYVTVEMASSADDVSFAFSGPTPAEGPFALTQAGAIREFHVAAGTSPGDDLILFPLGQYVIQSSGGSLGSTSATLDDSAPAFASAPSFTNYDQYEHLVAKEPAVIQVSGFTPRSGSTNNWAVYKMFEADLMGNSTLLVEGVHDGSSPFSFGVGAGITRADRYYTFTVDFFSDMLTPNAGFGGATAIVSSSASNSAYFYVQEVPEPTTLLPLTLAGVTMLLRARRSRRNLSP
jgi:hypothetical protein